jgi:glycosyltransferase involved in cell wall biosynthesis
MNAADLLLVTSFSETGPLVVKEAVACHCPIVSTDVGDVKEVIKNIKNSHITNYNVKEIHNTIKKVIKTKNQNQDNKLDLSHYSLEHAAKKIKKVYQDSLESPTTQSTN